MLIMFQSTTLFARNISKETFWQSFVDGESSAHRRCVCVCVCLCFAVDSSREMDFAGIFEKKYFLLCFETSIWIFSIHKHCW